MAKQVSGFMSEAGVFHETEEAADFHDAALNMRRALLKFFHNDRQSNEDLEKKCDIVHSFINTHTDTVATFIRTKDDLMAMEAEFVNIQPTLEVQEKDPDAADLSGDDGDRTERTQSEDEITKLEHRRSVDGSGGLESEELGTNVSGERSEETSNNVEGDNEAKG